MVFSGLRSRPMASPMYWVICSGFAAFGALGLALGPGLFAVVLAIGGYRSSTDGDAAQPDSALTAIRGGPAEDSGE